MNIDFSQTLHSVCRIAEVLIKLQQAGNIMYIGWRMTFCCQTLLVADLQKQAKVMEEEFESWDKELSKARKRFYELNYYTTRQLLVLRSELGRLKFSGPQHSSCGHVIVLLKSISSEITIPAVANVVKEVAKRTLENIEDKCSPVSAITPAESRVGKSSLVTMSSSLLANQSITATTTKVLYRLPSLPTVGLSREALNDEQKVFFTDIIESFGYYEATALSAIEAVQGGDWNDIVNFLGENASELEAAFLETEGTEDSEKTEDELESSEDEQMESESETESGLHLKIENAQSVWPILQTTEFPVASQSISHEGNTKLDNACVILN